MTGQKILENALDLCGLRSEDGTIPSTVNDLVQRSVSLINILLAKYEQLNCRVTGEDFAIQQITTLSDTVEMHDMLMRCILPLSLASLLIQDEDQVLALAFEKAASTAASTLNAMPDTTRHGITEVY